MTNRVIASETMLRLLNDALDYMDYDTQRARNLIARVIYWLEDEVESGEEEEEEDRSPDY